MTSLEIALRLRELGFSVIPLRMGTKEPAIAWSVMQRLAAAPATIKLWYSKSRDPRVVTPGPNANVGIVIGAISDCIAIDWDAPHEGDTPDQIDAKTRGQNILQRIGVWDRPHVVTGRGGRHFYGKFDPRLRTGKPTNGRGFPLFETKTTGTQLVAPGSFTATGAQYIGDIEEIAKREPFPEALFELIAELSGEREARKEETETESEDDPPDAETGPEPTQPAQHLNTGRKWLTDAIQDCRRGADRNDRWLRACVQIRDDGLSKSDAMALAAEFQRAVTGLKAEPYAESEARATVNSVYNRPRREPAASATKRGRGRPRGESAPTEDEPEEPTEQPSEVELSDIDIDLPPYTEAADPSTIDTTRYRLTDTGNSEVMRDLFGENLRYDPARGQWLYWLTQRWQRDKDGEALRISKAVARLRRIQADSLPPKARTPHIKWAERTESRDRRKAMIELAATETGIASQSDVWDANPHLLGVHNGVVELPNGMFRPGHRDDHMTLCAGTAFDPDAKCPAWLAFLASIFPTNTDVIDYLQRGIGYSLTGETNRPNCFFLLVGSGRNGKGVLTRTISAVLGDYAATTPFATFESDAAKSGQTNDLAALVGKRFVIASEGAEGGRLNEARIKNMSGGDPITCRFLHREFFTYTPQYKIWLSTNHMPQVRDTSHGMWARLKLIEFRESFIGREDHTLEARLLEELPGILNWALAGCQKWDSQRLVDPASVKNATGEFRVDSDPIQRFLDDRVDFREGAKTKAADMYEAYIQWCRDNGEYQLRLALFGMKLTEKGIKKARHKSGNVYKDVDVSAF